MRSASLSAGFLLLACACGAALAQTPPPADAPPARTGRPDAKIERITHEDAGSRVDELRVGGQTQTITVQPKNGSLAYEVLPTEGGRSAPAARTDGSSGGGQRVWNVLNF